MNSRFAERIAEITTAFEFDLMALPEISILIDALASTRNGPSKEVLRTHAKDTLIKIYGLGYLAGRASMRKELVAAADDLFNELNKAIGDHLGDKI
jgi:hypothetical protein